MQDRQKAKVDDEWVGQRAVELLEKALESDDPDIAACTKLMEVISKTLMPKTRGSSDSADADLAEARKEAMARARAEKRP